MQLYHVRYAIILNINNKQEDNIMKAGFIGLGNLGRAIAGRLIDQGVELTVFNRTREKAEGIGAASIASTAKEVFEQTDITFICLFDSMAVASVLMGPEGLADASKCGIVIDTTTNHFDPVMEFHGFVADKGGTYLESPVLGSVVPAAKGLLTVLVSGPLKAYKTALPFLEKVGANIFHLPEQGTATRMKLINNLVLGSLMATLAESVSLAEGIGLSREEALNILATGAGKSMVLEAKRQKLIDGDFSPHFSNALIYKDLHCLQDMAYEMKRPAYTGAMAKELYAETIARGLGDEDFSGVYRLFGKT